MRTRVLLAIAAALILVVGMTAIASNMGFKISIPLTAGYTNFVSLPYYNNFANANELYSDIAGCTEVSRWDNATALWDSYIGARGTGFTLNEAEALTVKVAATNTWTPSHY